MSKTIPPREPETDSAFPNPSLAPTGYQSIQSNAVQPGQRALQFLKKVPEVTVYFWIIKLLTTAMGEVTSDFLVNHLAPEIAVGLGFIGFVVALAAGLCTSIVSR